MFDFLSTPLTAEKHKDRFTGILILAFIFLAIGFLVYKIAFYAFGDTAKPIIVGLIVLMVLTLIQFRPRKA